MAEAWTEGHTALPLPATVPHTPSRLRPWHAVSAERDPRVPYMLPYDIHHQPSTPRTTHPARSNHCSTSAPCSSSTCATGTP